MSRFLSLLVIRQLDDFWHNLLPDGDMSPDSGCTLLDLSFDILLAAVALAIGLLILPLHRTLRQDRVPLPFLLVEWFFLFVPRMAIFAGTWAVEMAITGEAFPSVVTGIRMQVVDTVPVSWANDSNYRFVDTKFSQYAAVYIACITVMCIFRFVVSNKSMEYIPMLSAECRWTSSIGWYPFVQQDLSRKAYSRRRRWASSERASRAMVEPAGI